MKYKYDQWACLSYENLQYLCPVGTRDKVLKKISSV